MCVTQSDAPQEQKRFTLAQIYQLHFSDFVTDKERQLRLKDKHFKAVDAATSCRTEKLGICFLTCLCCGDTEFILRSCKHRFCGRCGSVSTKNWAVQTLSRLMDISHHHIVMTLPKPFRKLSQMNGDLIHDCLLQAAAKVLKDFFRNKYNIQIGIVSVLHTAGSDLKYHPHVHMIVSRGGRCLKTGQLRKIEGNFLCEQRLLGQKLKNLFCNKLDKLYQKGKIKAYKSIEDQIQFRQWMNKVSGKYWIVSVQKPLDDVVQIVKYVGRYTKRACLSELKILAIKDNVQFKFNDYKNTPRGQKPVVGVCTMKPTVFLDKLLQHVPNPGFKMVRYYGLYNPVHLKNIPQNWKVDKSKKEWEKEVDFEMPLDKLPKDCPYFNWRKAMIIATGKDPFFCPFCRAEKVVVCVKYINKIIILYEEDTS